MFQDVLQGNAHGCELDQVFIAHGQGKGKLYDDLLVLRKTLGLEVKVKLLGFVGDGADFLANIDLFLSTSISEGLPLSAIQAMVAALPIVATRCGGYEGLITDGENGLLVDVGNPDAIAETIETVASDPELQKMMATNAKIYAIETYDIQVMLSAYARVYDRFLEAE